MIDGGGGGGSVRLSRLDLAVAEECAMDLELTGKVAVVTGRAT